MAAEQPSIYDPPERTLADLDHYKQLHRQSIEDPETFWTQQANELVSWHRPFEAAQMGAPLADGDIAWFVGGQLNACYNCVDRHALRRPDAPALIYEADEAGEGRTLSFRALLREVCRLAQVLRHMGVRKGDAVAIYMPMIPEAVIALLACARIGALHTVVFAGFSADSLRDRIVDAGCRVVLTADEGQRGGKTIAIKRIVDQALAQCPAVSGVLVFQRTGEHVPWTHGRDHWWHEEVAKWPGYVPPVWMDAEDPLFLLYTSGSTGKPKGILHTTGGYLVGAAATAQYVFDLYPGDRLFCGGDIGWITGHTYVVYAPLVLGVATIVFEGTPAHPSYSRYWDIVREHAVSHFYAAPTALRLLKRADQEVPDMPTLRVLGSVGEPIAPEVWKWYYDVVGKGKAQVVDTYWQTETGSHVIAPLAGASGSKPGSASLPFFGIEAVLLDPVAGTEISESDTEGVLAFKQAWPSMARTVYGCHERYLEAYLRPYPGYYTTGDGAVRDEDGFYWIRGRVDDVINVSGHRLSTAEIEAALIDHSAVAEAAVVAIPDDLTGQALAAFLTLKHAAGVYSASGVYAASGSYAVPGIRDELIQQVRRTIGPFAAPKRVYLVSDLPKTRSGKIMRRVLRKMLAGEADKLGDLSTLADPGVVDKILDEIRQHA